MTALVKPKQAFRSPSKSCYAIFKQNFFTDYPVTACLPDDAFSNLTMAKAMHLMIFTIQP